MVGMGRMNFKLASEYSILALELNTNPHGILLATATVPAAVDRTYSPSALLAESSEAIWEIYPRATQSPFLC